MLLHLLLLIDSTEAFIQVKNPCQYLKYEETLDKADRESRAQWNVLEWIMYMTIIINVFFKVH